MDALLKDFRLGLRRMRRDLLLTAVAVGSLAIGIGANTALYTVASALLFRPQPGIASPHDLVDIGRTRDGAGFNPLSYPEYVAVRDQARTLRDVYATNLMPQAMSLATSDGRRDRLFATYVSSRYFPGLGVTPAAGRVLDPRDGEGVGAAAVLVISDGLWARLFNRDRSAVGATLIFNGQPATIVGVAPAGFHGTGVRSSDAWLPIGALQSADSVREQIASGGSWLLVGGRRASGAPVAQVNAEIQTLAQRLPADSNGVHHGLRAEDASPIPGGAGPVGVFLTLIVAVVATVLLVTCANVAGMLLSRVPARQREMAVRAAVGATRARLARQLLAETLILFAAGAGLGLLVAAGLARAVQALLPAFPFPLELALALDGRALLFTTLLALITAMVSGLVPAAQASRVDLGAAIQAEQHGARGMRLRRGFVVAQVALSLALVVVGGLFTRAMLHAGAAAPGFDAHGVDLVSLDLGTGAAATEADDAAVLDTVVARVRRIPGVERVSVSSSFPGGFEEMRLGALRDPRSGRQADDGEWNIVAPGFFAAIRMPLRAGRDFDDRDRAGAPRVAVIGEGTAHRLFPGQPVERAVGVVIEQLGFNPATRRPETLPVTIVGVSADPAYGTLIDGRNDLHVYVPMTQVRIRRPMLIVRTTDGRSAVNEVRAAITALSPRMTVESTRAAEEYSMLGLLPQRVGAWVTAALGLVGLLLAAIGVYGVTASAVARRRREIGIRLALGAPGSAIGRLILGEGLTLVVAGAVIGLPLALGAGQAVSGHLAGIAPADPVTFWSAAGAFGVMGLLACTAPLVRALRISPTETLRDC